MSAHITILSDSQKVRDVMQAALSEADYQVSSVCTSFYDLADLAGLEPDLLILDWLLGLEDHGLQVLQTIKLYKPLVDLPILVCAAATRAVSEMATRLQAADVELLYKPFTLAELVATVSLVLTGPTTLPCDSGGLPNGRGTDRVSGQSTEWRRVHLRPMTS